MHALYHTTLPKAHLCYPALNLLEFFRVLFTPTSSTSTVLKFSEANKIIREHKISICAAQTIMYKIRLDVHDKEKDNGNS